MGWSHMGGEANGGGGLRPRRPLVNKVRHSQTFLQSGGSPPPPSLGGGLCPGGGPSIPRRGGAKLPPPHFAPALLKPPPSLSISWSKKNE